ncbi:MAG: hypothetical protein M3472_04295 [Chloroflexota bacterium]|nr:hypothetical protein [Chloroflexota bacterium]
MAALAGILIVGGSPGTAAADCSLNIEVVHRPADARGLAFLGSLEDVQEERVTIDHGRRAGDRKSGQYRWEVPPQLSDGSRRGGVTSRSISWKVITFVFDVERVYEGTEAKTIGLPTTTCHGLHGFQLGERYLVSTAGDLSGPRGAAASGDTLAWRVLGNEQIELLGFDVPARAYSDELRGPQTVSQALRLLGLDDGLPPTDAVEGGSPYGAGMLPLVAATFMALALAAFLVRPVTRRSRRDAGADDA